ncbi:hypothetical protein BCR44DRAFT_60376 [Catenaria anguillulae PL171]|uniref:Uncharacterized protein n=1 Tax=Catenaria anguillulae PL171 TaxID=765915 RepID=A0A1Y2HHT0_9FUNG|nr:hypothetical protein BCR44DRAFT_60376 [Catenaria anguillulae PL171]
MMAAKDVAHRTSNEIGQLSLAIQHAVVAVCKVVTRVPDIQATLEEMPKVVTEDHLRSYSSLTHSAARLLTNGASGHVPIAGGQASQQQQQQQRRKSMDFARLQLHASLPALATPLPAAATSSADGQFLAWLQSTTFTSVSSVGDLFACLDQHRVRSLSPPMIEFFVSVLNKSRAWRKAKGNSSHPPRAIVLVDADNRHGSPELVDALDKSPWLDVYAHGLAGEYRKWTASKLVEYTPAFRSMTEETDMDMVIRAFLPENVAKLQAATAVVIVSGDNSFGVLQTWTKFDVACALLRVCITGKGADADQSYVAPDPSRLVK